MDTRDTPEMRAHQRALHDWHTEWTAEQVARKVDGSVPDGRKVNSDYNQHVPDLDASISAEDEYHARARQILDMPAR